MDRVGGRRSQGEVFDSGLSSSAPKVSPVVHAIVLRSSATTPRTWTVVICLYLLHKLGECQASSMQALLGRSWCCIVADTTCAQRPADNDATACCMQHQPVVPLQHLAVADGICQARCMLQQPIVQLSVLMRLSCTLAVGPALPSLSKIATWLAHNEIWQCAFLTDFTD